jgi:hypothetical protein
LLEGVDYKSLLSGGIESITSGKTNPINVLQQLVYSSRPKYEESHEAINRDSCKLVAEYFNNACRKD